MWIGEIPIHGFVKKTQKTPKEEIQLAKDRRKDFINRNVRTGSVNEEQYEASLLMSASAMESMWMA